MSQYLNDNYDPTVNASGDGVQLVDQGISPGAYSLEIALTSGGNGGYATSLDFDAVAGQALASGTTITNQFAGLTISTPSNDFGAMIFDTANPTGGDYDLRSSILGNVLIISEDGDASDPDDNATGGVVRFDWDSAVDLSSIGLLDVDSAAFINLLADDGSLIQRVDVDPAGDNQFQTVALGVDDVSSLEVSFSTSGAIANINLDTGSGGGSGNTDGLQIGLYDAETNGLLQVLEEGDSLSASSIRDLNDVNIAALVPGDSVFAGQVESMQVLLNGVAATDYFESVSPYALFGDTLGDYFQGSLPTGDNQVTFELYSEDAGQGQLIGTVERNFSIV